MTNNTKQLGDWGENKAVEFLRGKKYKIIEQNWQNKWGEIDIIAKKKGVLIFVEVKTIKKQLNFSPFDQINQKKQKQLMKMAQIYLSSNKLSLETPHQIDIIAIERTSSETNITHLKNALEDIF